jgi:single-strand DNA-binding protein
MNMNLVVLGGNIGTDLELRVTPSGRPVLNFRMCTNERFTRANGEKVDKPTWHNIVAWGKTAENIAKFFKKGDSILISQGRIQQNTWTAEDGTKRSRHEVVVDRFTFPGTRKAAAAPEPTGDEPDVPFEDATEVDGAEVPA